MRTTTALGIAAIVAGLFALAPRDREGLVAPDPAKTAPRGSPKSRRVAAPARVVFAPWGAGPGEVSRRVPEEGSPEGPMSFAVDRDGRVLVLDQIAARVVVFENGVATSSTPIGIDTAQDLEVDRDGRLVLLDRLVDRSVRFVEPIGGGLLARVPIEGLGVREPGGVTALFARDDGAWIEVEHGRLIRVARHDGSADPVRVTAPGRFAGSGQFLRAERDGADVVVRMLPAGGGLGKLHARTSHASPIAAITGLGADERGRTFVASWRIDRTGAADVARHTIVAMDPSGAELARAELPATTRAEETFRTMKVGHDGAAYAMVLGDAGLEIWRWSP